MNGDAWPMAPLGDIFDIGAGKTMSAAARADGSKVPFLRTSNVFWDRLDLSTVDEMVTDSSELRTKDLQPGDLLVCEGGEIGRAAIWDGSISPVTFQNHLHRLRPKQRLASEIEPRFYVFFLQSGFTQQGIFEGAGNKTTIPNLSRNRLAGLDVPLPPKDEQRAIVGVLGAVRSALDIQASTLEATEALKRAVMQELFTRGPRGGESQDSEIGLIPAGWEPRAISDLCDIWSGGTPRKGVEEFWAGDIPWVSGKDIKRPAITDAIDHISEAGASAGSRIAPSDAVLLLVRGMGLAKDLPVATISRPMAFNQDVKGLTLKSSYAAHPGRFLRSAIYAGKERLRSQIVPSAHGTMTLNLNDVESMVLPWPRDADESHAVVEVLDALDAKIDLHRQKRALYEELFQGLLHGLMTQEISVGDLDLTVLPEREAMPA